MPRFLGSESAEIILSALGDALDLPDFGLLLNPDLRACFLNRWGNELWTVDPALKGTSPTFREIIDNAATLVWNSVPAEEMTAFLDEREAEVRAGSVKSRTMDVANGRRVLFECIACPSGGRILTYTDLSHDLQRDAIETAEWVGAELRYAAEALEEQGADLVAFAEAATASAQSVEDARRLLEHEVAERRELEVKLRRLATTDGLTGALNRAELLASAQRWMDAKRDVGTKLVVLMIDVDHFKAINDRFGHAGGDRALQHLVTLLRAGIRQHDLVGRLGGEEFAVVLLDSPRQPAEAVAERLRQRVADGTILLGDRVIKMAISIGLAIQQTTDRSIEQVVGRADEALYRAKRSGRNRVVTNLRAEVA
ncbi:MAG: GGDEF domain-containing protein [Rhodopila sp.]|jgi:diguanylate cyclase (GGDEF)-like protein